MGTGDAVGSVEDAPKVPISTGGAAAPEGAEPMDVDADRVKEATALEPREETGSQPVAPPAMVYSSRGVTKTSEQVWASRQQLFRIPCDEIFELPGRPHVVYELKNYAAGAGTGGAREARDLVPFLFKAFETGKQRPPAPGTKDKNRRAATIHEFLDWTVEGEIPVESQPFVANAQDFKGFRVISLMHRYRPAYPQPGTYDYEVPPAYESLAGPRPPLPVLIAKGRRPVTAATVRTGEGYMEVPFFATVEHRKGQGFGRAMLEAIEEVCRALGIPYILLCSENAKHTKAIWEHLGFGLMSEADLTALRVTDAELLHMDNTVQMFKRVQPRPQWRSLRIVHEALVQRVFFKVGPQTPVLRARFEGRPHEDQCASAIPPMGPMAALVLDGDAVCPKCRTRGPPAMCPCNQGTAGATPRGGSRGVKGERKGAVPVQAERQPEPVRVKSEGAGSVGEAEGAGPGSMAAAGAPQAACPREDGRSEEPRPSAGAETTAVTTGSVRSSQWEDAEELGGRGRVVGGKQTKTGAVLATRVPICRGGEEPGGLRAGPEAFDARVGPSVSLLRDGAACAGGGDGAVVTESNGGAGEASTAGPGPLPAGPPASSGPGPDSKGHTAPQGADESQTSGSAQPTVDTGPREGRGARARKENRRYASSSSPIGRASGASTARGPARPKRQRS